MQGDLIVYKVVRKYRGSTTYGIKGAMFSPYQHFQWEEGQHYYQDDDKLGCESLDRKMWISAENASLWSFNVHEGLHACLTPKAANILANNQYNRDQIRIVEMIIPNGAKYYADKNSIVATEMVFPENAKVYTISQFQKKFKNKIYVFNNF